MERSNSNRLVDIVLIAFMAASTSHCSEAGFSGSNSTSTSKATEDDAGQSEDGSAATSTEDLGGTDGGGTGASGTQRRDTFAVTSSNKADIVLVVDTSGSMREEKVAIEQNMQKFVDGLGASGLDALVTVIGKKTTVTDIRNLGQTFAFPTNLPADKFVLLDQYIHSTDAIGHLNRYFAGAIATTLPLRAGVPVEVAIISDDNGSNVDNNPYMIPKNTAAEYVAPAGKKVTINAIVGKVQGQSPTNPDCDIENIGTEHLALQTLTGGTYLDLCERDWGVLLKALTDKIVARNSGYKLNFSPDISKIIEVRINDKVVEAANYKIDEVNMTLTFASGFFVPNASKITITYFVK